VLVVKTPVVPELVRLTTEVPSICGLLLLAVGAYTTPRAVTVESPAEVTFPPRVALVEVTLALVGVVTVGASGTVVTIIVAVPLVLEKAVAEPLEVTFAVLPGVPLVWSHAR
jgi:hypothetical protein